MATFTTFGSAFNDSENRLAAAKAAAIQRVVADTGFGSGGALGPGGVSIIPSTGAGSLAAGNETLASFLRFTSGVENAAGQPIIGGTGGRTGGGGGGIPGVGAGIFGVEGPGGTSGPSRLLQSSGSVSRRFQTGGGDGGGGAGGGADGDRAQISRTREDLQPILEGLLAQLVESGGTPQSQQNSATRMAAAAELLNTIQQLTPANAEARSIAAVDLVVQRALEQALPQLQAAGESAGTSQNALQALSINDLATRTAGTTAAVILDAIANFATVQAQAGGALQGITEQDPVSRELLALLTETPTERTNLQASGNIDLLAALGLTPENLIEGGGGGGSPTFVTGG